MRCKNRFSALCVYLLSPALIFNPLAQRAEAESAADYVSVPPLINTSSSGDKPNVLFILDNSNSMDEAPTGQAVGSASSGSKSEIARNAIEDIIDSFGGITRMGLMAYKQSSVKKRRLHDSQYDASFKPSNYDASFTGDRASSTKRYRVPNPTDSGNYIYYNVALPFYANSNYGTAFCYSSTAKFDNGSENPSSGPWDSYKCYKKKTGTSDANSGFSSHWFNSGFSPTDSDYAQNILDFGTNLTWQYVSETWFSNVSPGKGYLHVEVKEVDSAQKTALKNKLATSQFATTTDTPLRNAGLTPIQGTLKSALAYYGGSLSSSDSTTSYNPKAPPANSCAQQDYVILVTDGLPSTDASGNKVTDTNLAIQAAADEAAKLFAQGIKTFVIGFALPTGVDASLLNKIAVAGGTGSTYLANNSSSLTSSLQSIFLSFANRQASASSSAVLAKNSRGEGAVFQAVYSPELEDSLGNEVSWVGNVFGLFIDSVGLLREDTNQNGQLDGYTKDRVADYYFDSVAGKTKVKLFYGAGANTAPDPDTAVPAAVIDVDQLATLWETRSHLGNISDVLNQRAYGNNASGGRHIISSVDGSTTIDFVPLSNSDIDDLVVLQTEAASVLSLAESDKNVAEVQYSGLQTTFVEDTAIRDSALADRNQAQIDVDDAQAALAIATSVGQISKATTDLNDALATLDLAQTALDDAETQLAGTTAQLSAAKASYDNALLVYDAAFTAYTSVTAKVNNSSTLVNYLDVPSISNAYNIVKYVRGEDITGFRSRSFDYDNDGLAEVWRLGDVVHSSPVIAGSPAETYDARFGDKTYTAFREKYKNRRRVLYVGANDGMLHAFNAGFWDGKNKAFKVSNSFVGGAAEAHPLGAELWAYVPRAALPHLQWLTDPNYGHSYYVDGNPILFDANIFANDATHPYGWGTVLMIGMRFGGGPIAVDSDADGSDDTMVRSSYALFDVTDPEQAPQLIAEISDPNIGFTSSVPTVVKKRVKGIDFKAPTTNEWYVAFGSGPTELDDASSTQQAALYLYDLKSKAFVSGFDPLLLENNSFVGDVTVFDDGDDFVDDTLYYGVTGGSPAAGSTGMLKRTMLDSLAGSSTSTLMDTSEPVISAPLVSNDRLGRRWINYGTGRLIAAPDNITTEARHFYGVMEPVDSSGALTKAKVLASDLEDTTNFDVEDTGVLSEGGASVQIPSGTDVGTYNKLITAIRDNRAGWLRKLGSTTPATRNVNRGVKANNVLFYSAYSPSANSCQPEGTSRLYAVDFRTGTGLPFEVFAVDDDPASTEGDVVDVYLDLGQGLSSAPMVLHNTQGASVFTSKSTTEQSNEQVRIGVYKKGRQSWQQLFLN